MIVIVVSSCPPSLRGDLTLWLQEIATGVYVGHVSARVREKLWERVVSNIKNGQATLVYSTNNEQGHSFQVHGTTWEVIEHEGIELILKPSVQYSTAHSSNVECSSQSNAAQMKVAKESSRLRSNKRQFPADYVVLDIETTGINVESDRIIEIACLKVVDHVEVDRYHALLQTSRKMPKTIEDLTGISNELLSLEGVIVEEELPALVDFMDDNPIVAHNAKFDLSFIYRYCKELGIERPPGSAIDTLSIARRSIKDVSDYKLSTLLHYFQINVKESHRAIVDCEATFQLYKALVI